MFLSGFEIDKKTDERIDKENYIQLALHLERENQFSTDVDTIEKLFSITEEGFLPHYGDRYSI